MQIGKNKIAFMLLVLFSFSSSNAIADMEGNKYYPAPGNEDISEKEAIEHHNKVLNNMYDEYSEKLDKSKEFYTKELSQKEKLHKEKMQKRKELAEYRKEREAQRAEAHRKYLLHKAEMQKEQFEKKNYYVEVLKEKRKRLENQKNSEDN